MHSENRVLPVYLLLDQSALGTAASSHAARRAVGDLIAQLRQGLHCLPPERIRIRMLTFGEQSARLVDPLACLNEHVPSASALAPPACGARAGALGEAIRMLHERTCREVKPATEGQPGDWTPIVILVSDGRAADAWEDVLGRLRRRAHPVLLAAAPGPCPDLEVLRRISPDVLRLPARPPGALLRLSLWPRAELSWSVPCARCGTRRAETRKCSACGAATCGPCGAKGNKANGGWRCPLCGGLCRPPSLGHCPTVYVAP